MTMRTHIAAPKLVGSLENYAKKFSYLEVSPFGQGAPSAATLRKWRKIAPPSFEFGVVLGPRASMLEDSEESRQEVQAAIAVADSLASRVFRLITPREVTPSPKWRAALAKLVAQLPREVHHIVWEPSGLWEPEDASVLARSLGLVLVVDPAKYVPPSGPVVFGRLRALGETRSFGEASLARVLETVGSRRDFYLILDTNAPIREMGVLKRLIAEEAASAPAPAGRMLRPRVGEMRVNDDEQEE